MKKLNSREKNMESERTKILDSMNKVSGVVDAGRPARRTPYKQPLAAAGYYFWDEDPH